MKHPQTSSNQEDYAAVAATGPAYVEELQLMEMYRQIAQNQAYDVLTRNAANTRYQMIKRLHARRPKAF